MDVMLNISPFVLYIFVLALQSCLQKDNNLWLFNVHSISPLPVGVVTIRMILSLKFASVDLF